MMEQNKLDCQTAYELLIEGIIKEDKDFEEDKNRWILHCLYSGIAAGRIAKKLGIDSDYATALGYIHDIGRRISHPKHITEGYKYLKALGYEQEARICLTHSFIDNDITLAAGPFPPIEMYYTIMSQLNQENCSIYDNIIQLCDLFCKETGFTTLEKRILDISLRKGVSPSSRKHFESAVALKEKIEKKMGCGLYELFPEIPKEDLENVTEQLEELNSLFISDKTTALDIGIAQDNKLECSERDYYLDKLSRDGHRIFYFSSEWLEEKFLEGNKNIDLIYVSTKEDWEKLTEVGIPCFIMKKLSSLDVTIPTADSWSQLYQQVSIVAHDENYSKPLKKKNNNLELMKK